MHDTKVTNVEKHIPLIDFLKALYSTYSNYLESPQADGNLKYITFDSLVKKISEREKLLGRRQLLNLLNKLCVFHIERIIMLKMLLEEAVVKEEEISEARGEETLKEKSQTFIAYTANEMDHMMHQHLSFLGQN